MSSCFFGMVGVSEFCVHSGRICLDTNLSYVGLMQAAAAGLAFMKVMFVLFTNSPVFR